MVFSSNRNKSVKQNQSLGAQEAFNLWDILKSKYITVDTLELWDNFAHDKDLKLIFKYFIKEFRKNIDILEKQADKYSIKSPDHSKSYVKSSVNPEVISDEYIAQDIFIYIQEHAENLLKTLRSSMTNDEFRKIIYKMAINTINDEDKIVKYMKLKGWIETPPLYPNIPQNVDEKLTTPEAYNLWDHLAYRYDNIQQTKIFHAFAFDGDFKLLLDLGINTLDEQCKVLEKELNYFGINLPDRPSENIPPPANTEILEDDHMFRILFIGLQGAAIVHVGSLKQCTFNDRVRGLFKKLLIEEMNFVDKLVKFGKVKGWFQPPPKYRV